MRSPGLALVVLWSSLMTGSSGYQSGGPSVALTAQWKADLLAAHSNAQRPDRFIAALEPARRLALLYPRHRFAAKTSELAGYSLSLQHRFAEATHEYVKAKALAETAGDTETMAVAANALSNIYLASGNVAAALAAARQAVNAALPMPNPPFQAALENHYARLLARSGRYEESQRVFAAVIERSKRERLPGAEADAWKLMGREAMLRGELNQAERSLSEALRLRLSSRNQEIASDYHDLAETRLLGGHYAESLRLLDLAEHNLGSSKRFLQWRLYLLRGRAHLALSDSAAAIIDLRRAVAGIDSSPTYRLPGDLLRSQASRPTEAHELFAEAALNEFTRTGNRALLMQAFAATESGRATALRSASNGPPVSGDAAARYWNLVADLDETNARLLAREDNAARGEIGRIRLALAELESSHDRTTPDATRLDAPPPLEQVREGEALIDFQFGERLSLAWTIAAGRLEVTRLPPRAILHRQIEEWLATASGPEKQYRAHQLFRTLMGGLPEPVRSAELWLVAADGDLFQAPLAALVTGFEGTRPIYLAERHALQLIPGAWALERRQPAVRSGRFLGIGDPIYNEGDPRVEARRWGWLDWRGSAPALPRLASSGFEIAACARYWPSSKTFMGRHATPEELSDALRKTPAAIHLAIHVVPAPDTPSENLIALGAGAQGQPAYVGPEWIGAHRLAGSLVFMNGCRSGSGAVSSGEGLMGLTRAWLRAGASRVVSTYWPTLDDGGQLASAFYSELIGGSASTPEALRRAQLTMIRQADWRADPQYWAAYFLIGYPE